MHRIRKIILFFALFVCLCSYGQVKWNQTFQDYIDTYKEVAIDQMLRYHIPASITLAQGLLESGAGKSELATKGNNHFGIKCHSWTGRTMHHDDDLRQECFRCYDSALESYEDHSKFLTGKGRYSSLFNLAITDYKGWAHGLKAAGYATNPKYAPHLIEIIEVYQLYQYDTATSANLSSYQNKTYTQPVEAPRQPVKKVEENYANTFGHEVKICNNTYYIIARQGDTFESLAQEFGLKASKLAGYNDLPKGANPEAGKPVFLETKKGRADKSFSGVPHIVSEGESLHSIAQKYAIKMSSLLKMNHIKSTHQLSVGEPLIVY